MVQVIFKKTSKVDFGTEQKFILNLKLFVLDGSQQLLDSSLLFVWVNPCDYARGSKRPSVRLLPDFLMQAEMDSELCRGASASVSLTGTACSVRL